VELDAPPTSPQNKTDPLATLMREMTGREVEMALADEKVQAIRPQLMSGEAMVTCLNQGEVTELAIELDEAISILGGFHKSLEEDFKTRTKLIDALKVYIEAQELQKETTQKRLQDCKQELIVTEALKEQLKQLYEKLPAGSSHDEAGGLIPTLDPRVYSPQKRENSNDASSPEKRAKTTKPRALLPSPPPGTRPLLQNTPITNTILANQSYYTPDTANNTNNLYNSPSTHTHTALHNMHISSPGTQTIDNNANYNHQYNNMNMNTMNNMNNMNNLGNMNNMTGVPSPTNDVNNLNTYSNLTNLTNMGNMNNNLQGMMGYNQTAYPNDYLGNTADPYSQISNLSQYGY